MFLDTEEVVIQPEISTELIQAGIVFIGTISLIFATQAWNVVGFVFYTLIAASCYATAFYAIVT